MTESHLCYYRPIVGHHRVYIYHRNIGTHIRAKEYVIFES